MAVFGIKALDGGANTIIQEITTKLKSPNLLKNPFSSWSYELSPGFWVIKIEPVYPNVGLYFGFPMLLFVFWPWTFIGWSGLIIGLIMALISLWWTPGFYYLLFKLKAKGRTRYVSPRAALEGWYEWDRRKS